MNADATPYEVGLLLNFGPRSEIKRKAFDKGVTKMGWEGGTEVLLLQIDKLF